MFKGPGILLQKFLDGILNRHVGIYIFAYGLVRKGIFESIALVMFQQGLFFVSDACRRHHWLLHQFKCDFAT